MSYEKNRVSIDPTKLPLDKIVDSTAKVVWPARRAGVVVTFGGQKSGGSALVTFRDPAGAFLPVASTGKTGPDSDDFVVGYDGQALLEGLSADNSITITLPDGGVCVADVPYAAHGGDLVTISDVVCRPQ
jgi:outer membrane usher protein